MNKLKIPSSAVHSGWGLSQRMFGAKDLSLREENCKGNFEEIGWDRSGEVVVSDPIVVESKVSDEIGICNSYLQIFFVRDS